LLKKKSVSFLSVCNRSDIPRPEDKERIKTFSSQTLIAGLQSKRNKNFNKLFKRFNIEIRTLPSVIGIIRLRKNLSCKNNSWEIETFGEVESI